MIVDFFEQGDVLRFSFHSAEEGDKVIPSEKFQMGGRLLLQTPKEVSGEYPSGPYSPSFPDALLPIHW